MCYSQVFICASLAAISCHRRKAEVSEKTEPEPTAKGLSSTSDVVEVTAKSSGDWNNAQDTHPTIKPDKSKETQNPKSSPDKGTSDQQISSPDNKKAEISSNAKLPPVQSPDSAQKRTDTPKNLETLSFLNTEQKAPDDNKMEDETVNDAPSLKRINLSKASEEMVSIQTKKEALKCVQPPKPKEDLADAKLYDLQKTMASHSDAALQQLAVEKTPYPSGEL